MEKENLTPEESFDIITKAISNFKMNYKENSKSFLLWGWLMSLASFLHFIVVKILISKEAYEQMLLAGFGTWIIFVISGFLIEYFTNRKSNRDKKVFSHLDRFINILWKVTGVSIPIIVFLSIKLHIPPPPFFLLVMGITTTITGLLIRFRPVTFGGIAFYLFAIVSTFIPDENILLITGAAIICCYLIPGYFLKAAKE